MSPPLRIVLMMRRSCALCDEAKHLVRRWVPERQVVFDEIDVDGDPYLARTLGDAVPVGYVGGREVFRLRPQRDAVRRAAGLPLDASEPSKR